MCEEPVSRKRIEDILWIHPKQSPQTRLVIHERSTFLALHVGGITAYRAWCEARQLEIGHYFEMLYQVVKLVDRADGAVVLQKPRHLSIVWTLGLVLLAHSSLANGREKFKPLMEYCSLRKQMPTNYLCGSLHPEHVLGAFEGTEIFIARGGGSA